LMRDLQLSAFWLSLGIVFLAELGDKTQLVALCFATRYRAGTVLAAVFAATLVVHIFSVFLGAGAGSLLPGAYISLAAGLAFLGFGAWTLRGDSLDDDSCGNRGGRSAFWIVASTFFLAELGDKTMLSTVTLATDNPLIPVWLGSSLGMVISDGLAIAVGRVCGRNLPERAVKTGAAVVFFGFGVYKCYEGLRLLPEVATMVTVGAVAAAVLAVLLIKRRRRLAVALGESET
jgi:Ca2+/H+ antiporter, TMEM165/GDT1 family